MRYRQNDAKHCQNQFTNNQWLKPRYRGHGYEFYKYMIYLNNEGNGTYTFPK